MTDARSRLEPPSDVHTLLSLFSTRDPNVADPQQAVPTHVFVLGACEPRVTLYSQQCRALNLIWLLHETGALKEDGSVAVVGAGAGGLTAAAAAAFRGHHVLLLNDRLDAMPQQRFAVHRHLHPRIFDWPNGDWWESDARLPLLRWSEGNAHNVRQTILRQFKDAPWRDRIDYHDDVRVTAIAPSTDRDRPAIVSWQTGINPCHQPADVIILAVGFGRECTDELRRPPVYQDSYWDDPGRRWIAPGTVLISGGGDGGLTEALHAVFGARFQHRQILELAGRRRRRGRRDGQESWVRDVSKELAPFEHRWRHRRRLLQTEPRTTLAFLAGLDTPGFDRRLTKMLQARDGTAADGVILAVGDDDLAITSCALNRFLVARLSQVGRVCVIHSRLDFRDSGPSSAPGPDSLEVGSVVIRHGAGSSPLAAFESDVVPAVEPELFGGPAAALVDATRHRYWPDGFYPTPAKTAPPQPAPPSPRDDRSSAGSIVDRPVLAERAGAQRTRHDLDIGQLDASSVIVLGALEALALLDLALTGVAIERVARSSRPEAIEIIRTLFGRVSIEPSDSFTLDDRLRPALQDPDRVASPDMLDLGHLRAGTLVGAVASAGELEADAMQAITERLKADAAPWWTAYGYATARSDDVETQLTFAGCVSRGKASLDSAYEIAYAALCGAIHVLAEQPDPDRTLWAETLLTTAAFITEVEDRDDAMRAFAADLASRWKLREKDLSALAALLTLRALEPNWPGGLGRRFRDLFDRRLEEPPKSVVRDRVDKINVTSLPEPARAVFEQLAAPDAMLPTWRDVLRAEQALREESEPAAAHAAWILDGAGGDWG